MTRHRMEIVGLVIAGVIVGALGRLVHPGRDPAGWIATIAVGVAAVVAVGLLLGGLGFWGYLLAVIAAAVLVGVVGRLWPDRGATA